MNTSSTFPITTPPTCFTPTISERIVREKERRQITGLSRTSWWRYERDGMAPKRVLLGNGSIGWKLSELLEWISTRQAA